MDRYVCIHGHFYQPPRENPWLEAIELQDSAYPYHDWNERISAECYAANACSRIVDGQQRIEQIVNNYLRISFNFGPTLLAWMEARAPEVYQAILAADKSSQERFSGHGSAIAQVYNHMIMPLANRRDKYTQVLWGIADFRHRFGRKPEGMWLAETAVDLETLGILAEQGIQFVILSPYQASKVRPLGTRSWKDVSGGRLEPSMPYRIRLSAGKTMTLFFYDGPVSRAVAFEGLLNKGEYLADRLLGAFSAGQTGSQLSHIATDGETYGHHHRFGEMALAYALQYIESKGLARLTNYGEYMEMFPATQEAQIFENSAWSCPHGVERWRSNCGCNSGMNPGWNQEWRAPLREAFDWLRDRLAELFERKGKEVLRNPWLARNEYISVVLDRSPRTVESFLKRQCQRPSDQAARILALKLLEMQRHAMLMYTSCGWFFDELSGIETMQVVQYAGRAVQLAEEVGGESIEPEFLDLLSRAKSNIPEHGDGKAIYEKWVKPTRVTLDKVAGHFAVSSLFEEYGYKIPTYCYTVERDEYRLLTAGRTRLAVGRLKVTSRITLESDTYSFAVLHLGDHNLTGGVLEYRGAEEFEKMAHQMEDFFNRGEFPSVFRLVDKHFYAGGSNLKMVFRDEQRKVLHLILENVLEEAASMYRRFYEDCAPLMRFVTGLRMPLPKGFHLAADYTLNADLRRAMEADELDPIRIARMMQEVKSAGATLETERLEFDLRRNLERLAEDFRGDPRSFEKLRKLCEGVRLARTLPFNVVLWKIQNIYYELLGSHYPELKARVDAGEYAFDEWVGEFRDLGTQLSFSDSR